MGCVPGIAVERLTMRGRVRELEALRTAMRRRRNVVVVGPSASGRTRLLEQIRPPHGVRVVDDAHTLDHERRLEVLDTARAGTTVVVAVHAEALVHVPKAIEPWARLRADAVLLGPLTRMQQVHMCEELLAGRVDRIGCDPLFSLSGGRPGDLVELVLASRESGTLQQMSDGWTLNGPPALHRLEAAFAAQLRDRRLRRSVEALARLGGSITVMDALDVVTRTDLERLHAHGILVVAVDDEGTSRVSFARPVLAEWLRTQSGTRLRTGQRQLLVGDAAPPVVRTPGTDDAWAAMSDAVCGRIHEAESRLRRIPDVASSITEVAVVCAVTRAVVSVARLDRAGLDRAASQVSDLPAADLPIPRPATLFEAFRVELGAFAGADVIDLAEIGYVERHKAARDDDRDARILWNIVSATVALASGRSERAQELLGGVRSVFERSGTLLGRGLVIARQAWADAQSGAFEQARRHVEQLETEPDAGPMELWSELATAQAELAVGWSTAIDRLVDAGERAVAVGQLHLAVELVTAQLKLGHVTIDSLRRVGELHERVGVPRSRILLVHTEAIASQNADRLVDVASRYVQLGRFLDAAEALLQAARVSTRHERDTYRRRAAGLLSACGGAWTPLASGLEIPSLDEHDVHLGDLVTSGRRNAEIAAELYLSVRTVEARLSRLYRRMGVNSRRELIVFCGPLFRRASRRSRRA